MLSLLLVEKRILASGTIRWLAQTESGGVPDRFHSMLGSNEDERFILLEPVFFEERENADAYFADPTRRLEEVSVWTSDELQEHMPKNVRWGASLRPNPSSTSSRTL